MSPEAWLEHLRRSSGLAIDPEGRWRYGTGFVENDRVAELFHAGVAVREDGEVTLTVGRMWAYVRCEGPARFVRAVRDGAFELLGGAKWPLVGAVFGWGPDERLYVWTTDGGPARVLRVPHQALIAGLEEDPEGRLVLTVGDRAVPVVRLGTIPGAAAPRPAPRADAPSPSGG